MKPLLIFLALLMVFVMMLSFNADLMRYSDEAAGLKEAASECAAAAALSLEPAAYAGGRLVFDRCEAANRAMEAFDWYLDKMCRVRVTGTYLVMKGHDDSGDWWFEAGSAGDTGNGGSVGSIGSLGSIGSIAAFNADSDCFVTVCLYIKTENLFSVAGINMSEICRASSYELKTAPERFDFSGALL